METGKRRQRDRDEATKRTPMKTARRRWCDEDGATEMVRRRRRDEYRCNRGYDMA
ncbi:hypothetical protein DEO72_LG6g1610 [Vigna unguiculata]|uniref:Uncharacterized protein n=1 Tax=Vigna unguiculata TaxID=3917 RepID=A0A4D6M887_VIGUN|nr:hypothetical protein DEO72_LG6g1610 [Vigna unguiculata]